MTATYTIEVDFDRDQTYGATDADITSYVTAAQWRIGMNNSYDDFAPPARATIRLSNQDGAFTQGTLGSELLSNSTFANWTGDNPDNWTVTGESGGDPEVSEVGSGESHGGTGTGKANLYTSSSVVSISQTILTSGKTYRCVLTINTIIDGGLYVYSGTTQVSPIKYHEAGVKTFYFVADSTTFKVATASGSADITLDSVSIKETAEYSGRLTKGVALRIKATQGATPYQLFEGLITGLAYTIGDYSRREVTLTVEDNMLQLLDAEFAPDLQTSVTADVAIAPVFDDAVMPYPYLNSAWLLEVEGYSLLDSTTILYDHSATDFETGITTHDFLGDNIDKGKGVSAQSFIRSMVASECGGRFWFDPRNNQYIFHNRHHDLLNTTVDATFTESEVESFDYIYADDLVNDMTVNYQPREVGAVGTVLWSQSSTTTLSPKQVKSVTARFRDQDNKASRIGAQDGIPLVPGNDFVANSASDGTGTDLTQYVSVGVEYDANSATINITNNRPRTVYLTTLQLRGTPLLTFNQASVRAFDGASQAQYNVYKQTRTVLSLGNDDVAYQYASYLVGLFKMPIERMRAVTVVDSVGSNLTQILSRTIGDIINVTESWSNHDADYVIVNESHTLIFGQDMPHRVTWMLKPTVRNQGWLLGTSGRSELDETAILIF